MEESLQLSTEQKLQQRLTPQQVQFVRMLEMTGPEIEDEVQRAIDENLALETVEDNDLALDNDSEEISMRAPSKCNLPIMAQKMISHHIVSRLAITVSTMNTMNLSQLPMEKR